MHFNADPCTFGGYRPQLVDVDTSTDAVLSADSDVGKRIHAVFISLETSPTNLLIIATAAALWVQLPRYKLSFLVNENGVLECKEIPGFIISAIQSIGTLSGLTSKLVLEPMDGQGRRKVIIPDGETTVSQGSTPWFPHPRVTITPFPDPGLHIRTFIYDVDSLICRLVGDGTLTSWFLLVYLHILTSHWLIDPFINRTGAQQAIHMLQSANSFSFMELTEEHIDILTRIVNITPSRRYYPNHLSSMETVIWHPVLSPLSQIGPYTPLVEAILDHGNKQGLFRSGSPERSLRIGYEGIAKLRERAEFRHVRYVSNDLQGTDGKPAGLLLYDGRSGAANLLYHFR
jgi:hypothetical protein